jgi:hypothetical protein
VYTGWERANVVLLCHCVQSVTGGDVEKRVAWGEAAGLVGARDNVALTTPFQERHKRQQIAIGHLDSWAPQRSDLDSGAPQRSDLDSGAPQRSDRTDCAEVEKRVWNYWCLR